MAADPGQCFHALGEDLASVWLIMVQNKAAHNSRLI